MAHSMLSRDEARVLTVGDVATPAQNYPECNENATLAELAQLILNSGQSAAVVIHDNEAEGSEGSRRRSLITETEILRCFWRGVPRDLSVRELLAGKSSLGKLVRDQPTRQEIPRPELPATSSLYEVRRVLQSGGHVMTHTSGQLSGVLSPLDVARATVERGWDEVARTFGMDSAATVHQLMAPLESMSICGPSSTLQQLSQALVDASTQAVLMADEQGVQGLATPEDALWAFLEGVCPSSENVWQNLTRRPGFLGIDQRATRLDAPLSAAADAMVSGTDDGPTASADAPRPKRRKLRHLLAVQPDSQEVVGVLSPEHFASGVAPSGSAQEEGQRRIPEPVTPPFEERTQASVSETTPVETRHVPAGTEAELAPKLEEASAESQPPKRVSKRAAKDGVKTMSARKRRKLARRLPHPLTVADVLKRHLGPPLLTCRAEDTLAEAAQAMVDAGRTAALVLDNDHRGLVMRGMLTENDILQAFVGDTPGETTIGRWLRGGEARLPGFKVPATTVTPGATLSEAAAMMASMAEEPSFACHHLVVRQESADENSPPRFHLLSALDIARGMLQIALNSQDAVGKSGRASAAAAGISVEKVMKLRSSVPTCSAADQLATVFEMLFDSQQNCALVLGSTASATQGGSGTAGAGSGDESEERAGDGEDEQKASAGSAQVGVQSSDKPNCVRGVVTTADVARAFAEYRGVRSDVGTWLRAFRLSLDDRPERLISADSDLAAAAEAMALAGIHHLVVTEPGGSEVVGVVSALDIVCAIGAAYAFSQDEDVEGDDEMEEEKPSSVAGAAGA